MEQNYVTVTLCISIKDDPAYGNKEMRCCWMKLDTLYFTFQFAERLLSAGKWHCFSIKQYYDNSNLLRNNFLLNAAIISA